MSNQCGITPSAEDYMETIYKLIQLGGSARTTDIAAELGVSKPSVNRAIKMLKSQALVEHELYSEIMLTEKGIEVAKNVYHRHNLLKAFLIDILGVTPEIAEEEACKMEHHMSPDTIKRLERHVNSLLPG